MLLHPGSPQSIRPPGPGMAFASGCDSHPLQPSAALGGGEGVRRGEPCSDGAADGGLPSARFRAATRFSAAVRTKAEIVRSLLAAAASIAARSSGLKRILIDASSSV